MNEGVFAQIYDESGAPHGVLELEREQQEKILDKYKLRGIFNRNNLNHNM